jgi:CHASE2 domain-containing sensor protein
MYGWLWRHLPGPTAVWVLLAGLLVAGVVALLFGWVFPAIESTGWFDDGTVST